MAVQQNAGAAANCQWSHQLTVQEKGGFQVTLTALTSSGTSGSSDFTAMLQRIFGTTRLAAYGTLSGTVCLSGVVVPSSGMFTIGGTSELGTTVTASTAVSYTAAATAPATMTATPSSVQLSGNGSVAVAFAGGAPSWTAATTSGASWLTVSPASGSGSASLTLAASAAGLSPGVYNATIAIQAINAVPQAIFVPVTFTVGTPGSSSIVGVSNGASFQTIFAPGMSMAVFGRALSPATSVAPSLPLPLTLSGVSATVNGITAPLYFVSPGQINLQIPYETGAGPAVLAINNNGQITSFPFQVSPSAPGIFAANGALVPQASAAQGTPVAMFITGDGDLTPTLATGATPVAGTALKNLPQPRLPLTVTVGGVAATVVFEGVTNGLAGVTQVNFTVPAGAPTGVQPVVVTVGGVPSAPVNLTVTASN
jgi:uncharacterized protein (TIGR03437 family)